MANQESISLYFSEGSSDKEYHAQIVLQGDGYMVNFQYGRRGSTLQSGSKTTAPVPYDKAKKVYDKLVSDKTSKGYSQGESGVAFQSSDKEVRVSGFLPQLLNPIEERETGRFLRDRGYCAQQKMDGERRMIRKIEGEVTGINRKGLVVPLPLPLVEAVLSGNRPWFTMDFLLDGELIGDVFYAFDTLEYAGRNIEDTPYAERFAVTSSLVAILGQSQIVLVRHAHADATEDKRALFDEVKAANKEGVVFKDVKAVYSAGRPASYGTQLKFKFVESCSCIAEKVNEGKRSVALLLMDKDGKAVSVGNVTIPPNYTVPNAGSVVEVQYLYAYLGGSLFQPVYRGERSDIDAAACTVSQLKFKPVAEAA